MQNRLRSIFSEVKIFVYLRKPIDIARSHLSTIIKWNGHTSMVLQRPWEEEIEAICNYQKTISLWSSVFGETNINVRLYKKEFLVGGNIISDFFNATGIGLDKECNLNISSNPKLNYEGMKILCKINENLPRITANGYDERHQGIVGLFEKYFSSPPFYTYSHEEVRLYNSYYKESDEFIFRKYFNSKKQLWESREDIASNPTIPFIRSIIRVFKSFFDSIRPKPLTESINDSEAFLLLFLDSWVGNKEKIIALEKKLKSIKHNQKS